MDLPEPKVPVPKLTLKMVMHLNFGGGSGSRTDEILADGKKTGITYTYVTKKGAVYESRTLDFEDESLDLLADGHEDPTEWVRARV